MLEVLDRPQQSRFSLEEMELLGLFGNQAAIALDLLRQARRAKAVLEDADSDSALLGVGLENREELDGSAARRRRRPAPLPRGPSNAEPGSPASNERSRCSLDSL